MNSYIGSIILATGNSAPFTGSWANIAVARNAMFVVYGSGITSPLTVNLESITPFSNDPVFSATGLQVGVPIYSFTGVSNGYTTPVFLDSPISQVRITVPTGAGKVWVSANVQN